MTLERDRLGTSSWVIHLKRWFGAKSGHAIEAYSLHRLIWGGTSSPVEPERHRTFKAKDVSISGGTSDDIA
jgi:hypothetical protein